MHNHGVFTSEYNLHDRLLHVLLQVWLFVLNRIFFFSTKRLLIVPFFPPTATWILNWISRIRMSLSCLPFAKDCVWRRHQRGQRMVSLMNSSKWRPKLQPSMSRQTPSLPSMCDLNTLHVNCFTFHSSMLRVGGLMWSVLKWSGAAHYHSQSYDYWGGASSHGGRIHLFSPEKLILNIHPDHGCSIFCIFFLSDRISASMLCHVNVIYLEPLESLVLLY